MKAFKTLAGKYHKLISSLQYYGQLVDCFFFEDRATDLLKIVQLSDIFFKLSCFSILNNQQD